MRNIIDDFSDKTNDNYLFLLPIERFSVSHKLEMKNIIIYPKGSVDIGKLLQNQIFLKDNSKDIEKFEQNTIIAFCSTSPIKFPSQIINDIKLLNYATEYLTPIIDFIIYNYCSIHNNHTLPGRIGQIETGETLLLMFHEIGRPLTRIISQKTHTNTITIGNGLKIYEKECLKEFQLLNNDISEIGNVTLRVLRMYAHILEANTNTDKLFQIIRLFEFIASPNEYEQFKKVKSKIISHIATSREQIHELSNEFIFYIFGNNKDGLRTQIIHQGKKIEELINENEIIEIFKKLHNYLFICITDLMNNYNKEWEVIENVRNEKRGLAEKNKRNITEEKYSPTLILIDGDFLSNSISRFQKLVIGEDREKNRQKESLSLLR